MNLDIAVVGGGIAGASSAWRLQQEEGVKKTIGVTTQLQDHIDK
jgi:glycine/D-amino acid oxidase-like deaminating enzyme